MKNVRRYVIQSLCLVVFLCATIVMTGKLFGYSYGNKAEIESNVVEDEFVRVQKDGTMTISTNSLASDVIGFQGKVPIEIIVKGGVVTKIVTLDNEETPSFFNKAKNILPNWEGKTIEEALATQVDAVSGATYSSMAIIGNVRRGLQYAAKMQEEGRSQSEVFDWSAKSVCGLIVVLLAAILPLLVRGKGYMMFQSILNVIVLGLWCGLFVSHSSLVRFLSNGFTVPFSLSFYAILIIAFIYPLFGKKNYYCNNVCPLGSAQRLSWKVKAKKWKLSNGTIAVLVTFRQILWIALMALTVVGVFSDWMNYELFAAFAIEATSVVMMCILAVCVFLSIFVQRPYCRFVCPTGTFLKMIQGSERFYNFHSIRRK